MLRDLLKANRGQTMVEYGLLVVLIAIVVIASLLILGPVIGGVFNNAAKQLKR